MKYKYKLARSLPFAEVGDVIYDFEGDIMGMGMYNTDCFVKVPTYGSSYFTKSNRCYIGTVGSLLHEGWIEEVEKEKMLTIGNKEYSESTIKEALKEYVQD